MGGMHPPVLLVEVNMTLNQLTDLNDDELAMALYIVNVIAPPESPKMEFQPRHLTWFKHDVLIKKFLDSFNRLMPEGHATYVSLMQKLGIKVEIKQTQIPNEKTNILPNTGSTPVCGSSDTGSIAPSLPEAKGELNPTGQGGSEATSSLHQAAVDSNIEGAGIQPK